MKPLNDARILFFVPDGDLATNGVYASQVGGLARYCEKLGAQTMIWDNGMTRKMWFSQVPSHFRKLARQDDRLRSFKPTHIYVRTYASAIAAKELSKKTGAKLIYSMRGADVAEALMDKNLRAYIIAVWSWLCVRRAVRIADHINAVSKTMVDWILRKFGRKASVLPCCMAQDPIDKFSQEGQDKPFKTIIYSGGLSAWQKIDDIITLMKKISEKNDNIRFRFLTKDVNSLQKKCEAIGLDASKWSVKSCKQSEVAGELLSADCGIILRDDILVNQVASPIKIGEYLSAGLGLITSPFIGDVGRDLLKTNFACLVDRQTSIDDIVAFVNGITIEKKISAKQWACENLTYEGNKSAVLEMFS